VQRRDIIEEIYKKMFYIQKNWFVVYNKSYIYIGEFVHINELRFERMHYTIVLEDLVMFNGIVKAHSWPSVEMRAADKMRVEYLIETAVSSCMKFKAKVHKGLQKLIKMLMTIWSKWKTKIMKHFTSLYMYFDFLGYFTYYVLCFSSLQQELRIMFCTLNLMSL
jgi:hypothetical protein